MSGERAHPYQAIAMTDWTVLSNGGFQFSSKLPDLRWLKIAAPRYMAFASEFPHVLRLRGAKESGCIRSAIRLLGATDDMRGKKRYGGTLE